MKTNTIKKIVKELNRFIIFYNKSEYLSGSIDFVENGEECRLSFTFIENCGTKLRIAIDFFDDSEKICDEIIVLAYTMSEYIAINDFDFDGEISTILENIELD